MAQAIGFSYRLNEINRGSILIVKGVRGMFVAKHKPKRLLRLLTSAILIIFILSIQPVELWAADGPINVAGKKLDTQYRFKRGEKFFPIEKTCANLGLTASREKGVWTISGGYHGTVKASESRDGFIERDKIIFAPSRFWSKELGLEVVEKRDTVFIVNKVVGISTMDEGILIQTAVPISTDVFTLDNPFRTVIDIPNLSLGKFGPENRYNFKNCPFTSIRLGQNESFPHKGRFVVDQESSSFTPVNQIVGANRTSLWIGRTKYVEPIEVDEKIDNLLEKSSGAPEILLDKDGSIVIRNIPYSSVNVMHLWDKVPYRAVIDLKDATLPFTNEKEFEGAGNILKLRVSQFEKKVARFVVETKDPIAMGVTEKRENMIRISPITKVAPGAVKIMLDAGHGGKDPGCQINGSKMNGYVVDEKDLNLKIVLRLGKVLEEMGFIVLYTRTTDTFLELSQRKALATRNNVDLFISIHGNSTKDRPQSYVSGPEVYYFYERDRKIAAAIARHMIGRTGFPGRGHLMNRLSVVMNPDTPSVLVEIGYMNNLNDLGAMMNPSCQYIDASIKGIIDGVTEVFGIPKASANTMQIQTGSTEIEPKIHSMEETPNSGSKYTKDLDSYRYKWDMFSLESPFELPSRSSRNETPQTLQIIPKEEPKKTEGGFQTFSPPDKKEIKGNEKTNAIDIPKNDQKEPRMLTIFDSEEFVEEDDEASVDDEMTEEEQKKWSEEELKKRRKNIFQIY